MQLPSHTCLACSPARLLSPFLALLCSPVFVLTYGCSNNVLDATKKWTKVITDPKEIDGLPGTALSLAAQQAAANGHEGATAEAGPWLLTLDLPCYQVCRRLTMVMVWLRL